MLRKLRLFVLIVISLTACAPIQATVVPAQVPAANISTPISSATPAATATVTSPPPSTDSVSGLIAFYSERDGNAEIYTMHADGSGLQRLTDTPADDMTSDWSPDGTKLVFVSDRDDPNPHKCFPKCNYEVYIMNADGSEQQRLTDTPAAEHHPVWSPNGSQIAFVSERDGNQEIYVMNADGSNPQRLTNNPAEDMRPSWSPGGKQMAFNSTRDGNWDIYVMQADGNEQRPLTTSPAWEFFPTWSPDGKYIAFFVCDPQCRPNKQDIYVVNADGSNVQRLTNTPSVVDEDPAWSPDGKHIVFQSDRDGNFEIYTMDADGGNAQRLTNNRGGDYWPAWQPAPANAETYLGESAPGLEPIVFQPESVSTGDIEVVMAIHPNLKEIYFTRLASGKATIMVSKQSDTGWTTPEPVSFSSQYDDVGPFVSADGQTLYFSSNRPSAGSATTREQYHIWFAQRTGDGWSDPTELDLPIESTGGEASPTLTRDGTLYYTSLGGEGLYRSQLANGQYQMPEKLDLLVNDGQVVEVEPFIAPDESFMLFYSAGRPDNLTPNGRLGDLYISFRDSQGKWSEPQNIGQPANSTAEESTPSLSPDGKYLFFASNRGAGKRLPDIYWVKAEFLQALKPR